MATDEEFDEVRLRAGLADAVDPSVSTVAVSPLGGGHSSGAWRLDVVADNGSRCLVLKAPNEPSVVFQRDAGREGRIMDALQGAGAPVPHTCGPPERWLYWRTLVEAQVPGWDGPCRGWFETSRYGTT